MKTVAIVGTRQPSSEQYEAATKAASALSSVHGVRIATGGAYGIDQAAMDATEPGMLDVYLPWWMYNRHIIPAYANITVANESKHVEWFESVEEFHPNPKALSRGARALHARNFGIVQNARVVLAFPNSSGEGGTGQSIRLARARQVPVFQYNRGDVIPEDFLDRILDML